MIDQMNSDLTRIGLARLYVAAAEIIQRDGLGASKPHRDEIARRETIVNTGGNDRALLLELQDSEQDLCRRLDHVRQTMADIVKGRADAKASEADVRCEAVTADDRSDL